MSTRTMTVAADPRAAGVLADSRVVLGGLLVLAALARLPGLVQRAEFDGDQGHDMLTLLRLTRDGVFPLLGPPTSIGDFHHGAFYYYLLAPAAAVSGSSPVAVEAWIALLGIAAVAVTWWLGRAIAGPTAGLVAGLLLAVSPAAIDESTFIWNPNPIPLFASLALASAWRGHETGRARWWALALGCAGVVFQLHVLGIVFVPPIVAFLAVEVAAARRRGDRLLAGRLFRAGIGGLAVIALLFVPLLVHELRFDWSETRNAIAYFTSGAPTPGQLGLPGRLVFTVFRVIGWPLVGLVTDAPAAAAVAVAIALALATWASIGPASRERLAARWLGLTVVWSIVALAVLAPSLQTVVAGLPNDHYHAFLDPIVVLLLGIAGARLAAARPSVPALRAGLGIVVVALVAIAVSRWPAWVDPNGGWPAAESAGQRIVATTGIAPVAVLDVPPFKTPEGIAFPIVHAGGNVVATDGTTAGARYWVVVCDRLFEPVVGAACGGPAEDALVARVAAADGTRPFGLEARFDASPRTSISVYRP